MNGYETLRGRAQKAKVEASDVELGFLCLRKETNSKMPLHFRW